MSTQVSFGRNAGPLAESRFGRASVLLAMVAFVLVLLGTGAAWLSADLGAWQMFAAILFLGLCYGLAPFILVAGIVFGIMGLLRRGESRMLSLAGIALNIAFIVFSGFASHLSMVVASHF